MRRREEGILTVMPFTLLLFGILDDFSLEAAFLLLCSLKYFRDYFYPLLEFFVQSEEVHGRKDKRADKRIKERIKRG